MIRVEAAPATMVLKRTSWLVCAQPNPTARVRLFCFPHGGGGVSQFRDWQRRLPADVELQAVQLPGRDGRLREQPFSSVTPLVEALASDLPPYLDRPYAFLGHSMGALIAFELARQLRRLDLPAPIRLLVGGRRAPQLPIMRPFLHELEGEAFIAALRRLGGTPETVLQDPQLMAWLTPILRADFSITETYSYVPETPLSCAIDAFGGLDDERVRRDGILAWQAQTAGAFSSTFLPGGHFFLNTARKAFLDLVAERLRREHGHGTS